MFWLGLWVLALIGTSEVQGKCCESKVVEGDDEKAGFYMLAMTSETVPDFCLNGCVYKKQDDENPGSLYCFAEGTMSTTCSSSGGMSNDSCSDDKGWMVKLVKEMCKPPVNKVIIMEVFEATDRCEYSYCPKPVVGALVTLFKGKGCEGEIVFQNKSGEPLGDGCYWGGAAPMFISIQEAALWSSLVEHQGYQSQCKEMGMLMPGEMNYEMIELEKKTTEAEVSATLSMTWTATPSLYPDVVVQSTPYSCTNVSREFSQSYASIWCYPTCTYVSWAPETVQDCECKGLQGTGLNFTELSYTEAPFGMAEMTGNIVILQDESNAFKIFLIFAKFDRKDTDTPEPVCESSLNMKLSAEVSGFPFILWERNVPCIPPQDVCILPQESGSSMPQLRNKKATAESVFGSGHGSGSGYGSYLSYGYGSGYGSGSGSGSGSGYGSGHGSGYEPTYEEYYEMIQEVDDALVYGCSDRYWLSTCITMGAGSPLIVDIPPLFSSEDPSDTPSFCGCIFSLGGAPSKEDTRQCYAEALYMGNEGNDNYPDYNYYYYGYYDYYNYRGNKEVIEEEEDADAKKKKKKKKKGKKETDKKETKEPWSAGWSAAHSKEGKNSGCNADTNTNKMSANKGRKRMKREDTGLNYEFLDF